MSQSHIVVVCQVKGGNGKSTLTANALVELKARGLTVNGVDADARRTLKKWSDRRNASVMPAEQVVTACADGDVDVLARGLAANADYTFIDTPGVVGSPELKSALDVADTVIIPVRASRPDIENMGDCLRMVAGAKVLRPHLRVIVVLSMTPTNPFMHKEVDAAREALAKVKGIELAPVELKERKCHRDAILAGKGVVELANAQAKAEMDAFINFLLKEGL